MKTRAHYFSNNSTVAFSTYRIALLTATPTYQTQFGFTIAAIQLHSPGAECVVDQVAQVARILHLLKVNSIRNSLTFVCKAAVNPPSFGQNSIFCAMWLCLKKNIFCALCLWTNSLSIFKCRLKISIDVNTNSRVIEKFGQTVWRNLWSKPSALTERRTEQLATLPFGLTGIVRLFLKCLCHTCSLRYLFSRFKTKGEFF